jgi:hypothetical protein
MSFKSEAQKRKIYKLKEEGKITQSSLDRFEVNTPKGALPERVTWKQSTKPKVLRAQKIPRK